MVAMDHGGHAGPLPGMIDLPELITRVDPGVSGILLSLGMMRHCGQAFGYKGAPMAITRLNWSTVFCGSWGDLEAHTVATGHPQEAMIAGADFVLISMTLKTGSEVRDASNVETFSRLAGEAAALGIPVVGEYFPVQADSLPREEMHEQVYRSCRILAELGADLIKTYYTFKFNEVTAACPVPVLGLGAAKLATQLKALEHAEQIVQGGGKGVVFGRNAIQVPDPAAFQRALCDVVQGSAGNGGRQEP